MKAIKVIFITFFGVNTVFAFQSPVSIGYPRFVSVKHQKFAAQDSQVFTEPKLEVLSDASYPTIQLETSASTIFREMTPESANAVKKVRKGSAPEFAIAGDSTVETPSQVAAVVAHFVITFLNLAAVVSATPVQSAADLIPIVFTVALSVVLGDFGTGVFHWATDNYGSVKTPVFGSVCAAFQGHHVTPWTITFRSFANNVYKICYGTIPALMIVAAVPMAPLVKMFFTLFITWWMISQELHKFSHMRSTPKAIKIFQDMGLILSKKEHGLHHTAPFEGHYCILTGICNSFLDDSKFFRHLENIVFKLSGMFQLNSIIISHAAIVTSESGNYMSYTISVSSFLLLPR